LLGVHLPGDGPQARQEKRILPLQSRRSIPKGNGREGRPIYESRMEKYPLILLIADYAFVVSALLFLWWFLVKKWK
jgi:hypothetical protein